MITLQLSPSRRDLRVFAMAVIPLFAALLSALLWWRFALPTAALVTVAAAVVIAVLGIVAPAWVRPLYVAWMVAAFPLGWLVGHLLLAIAYYLILTPVGIVMRLAGRDPLRRRLDRDADSYWTPRTRSAERSRYFRQF